MSKELNVNTFFKNYYIINPWSSDLTPGSRKTALISSIALGVFTLGMAHLVSCLSYYIFTWVQPVANLEIPEKNRKILGYIFNEIKETERSFLNQLPAIQLVASIYLDLKFITEEQASLITNGVPEMIEAGNRFLAHFERLSQQGTCVKNEDLDSTLSAYTELLNPERVYIQQITQLVQNHKLWAEQGLESLDQEVFLPGAKLAAQKYQAARERIRQEVNTSQLKTFDSFSGVTILPIQRLPRHKLLLEAAAPHIPDEHTKKPELIGLIESLKSKLTELNQA